MRAGRSQLAFGFFQEWKEADAIELWFFREAAQFDQSGIEVEKAHWPFANRPWSGYARSDNDQWHVVGLFPQGEFHTALLVAQMIAMIRTKTMMVSSALPVASSLSRMRPTI